MEILSEFCNVLIAAVAVAFVTYITHRQYRDLKQNYEALRQDTKDGFIRVDAGFARVDAELARMRSDITQIALATGTQGRPQTG